MQLAVPPLSTRAVKAALARAAYDRDEVRIVDRDLADCHWLVTSPQGVFAVGAGGVKTVLYGWFFGICRDGDTLYLFENCARRDRSAALGRIVRIALVGDRLGDATVLAKGLHANCHQVALIDGLLCLVDTDNQAIRRFTTDGTAVDVQRPFPAAEPSDTSGAYLHLNAIAQVGNRIAILLHNGKAIPEKLSELAWLDHDWRVVERVPLPGHSCHDIVADEHGVLWHSASMSGEIIASDGRRIAITPDLMTRGIAFAHDAVLVGISGFGPRHIRDTLRGGLVLFDRDFNRRAEFTVQSAPTDMIAL